MSTIIRPELSERNQYWIDKHRYYELKHFCMQYPGWKRLYKSLICFPSSSIKTVPVSKTNNVIDPVTKNLDERLFYADRINMLERVAKETDESLACYILKAITEGVSYDNLRVQTDIPCCKDTYYDLYRRFFWLLSKERQ